MICPMIPRGEEEQIKTIILFCSGRKDTYISDRRRSADQKRIGGGERAQQTETLCSEEINTLFTRQ